MLTLYDPLCNNLRDPRGARAPVVLSWRLGSDRAGACQARWHVVVTNAATGERAWDSGWVASADARAPYEGSALVPGETYVWFAEAADDAGEMACGVPAAFAYGQPGEQPTSPLGPACAGIAWTSAGIEETDTLADLGGTWSDALGVSLSADARHVRVAPRLDADLAFAQGSLLLPQGLLVVRWERAGAGAHVEVWLPPGTHGRVEVAGVRASVASGRHAWDCDAA